MNDIQTFDRHYVIRKLHSLTGFMPLALFLTEHLTVNSLSATKNGERNFDAAVNFLHSIPYLILVELSFIVIPMLFHGIYGLVITTGGDLNVPQYRYWRNAMYVFQRVSGIFVFVFVCVHLWMFRLQTLFYGTPVNFQTVRDALMNPWMMAFYILGVVLAVYHLANGLWNFSITWGITISPRAQKGFFWFCAAFGTVLSLAGINSLLSFTGRGIIF